MENCTLNPTAKIPTFQIIERKTHQNPKMGHHSVPVHAEPAAAACGFRRKTHRRLTRRKRTVDFKEQHQQQQKKKRVQEMGGGDQEEEEEEEEEQKEELERKIVTLQKIVPGGESLGVDQLFEETAGYILALQCQIKAMKVLSSFIEGFEKEKRKIGG